MWSDMNMVCYAGVLLLTWSVMNMVSHESGLQCTALA